MDNMPQDLPNSKRKRTPLGGGKRSRAKHCKKASQARWKSKTVEAERSPIQNVESEQHEHVLHAHGAAEVSCHQDLAGQDNVPLQIEEPTDKCTAKRKLDLMKEYIGAADDVMSDKERCFMELSSLQSLFSAVACIDCGGSLSVTFGDKMGYSREIKLVCQECIFTKRQYSCARMDSSDKVTVGFDINQSMVMCFNELGCGEAALRKFSAIMSIPGLAHNTYRRLSKKVGGAHREVISNVLNAAVLAVRDAYGDDADVDDNAVPDGTDGGEDQAESSDSDTNSDLEENDSDNDNGDTSGSDHRDAGDSEGGDSDSDGDDNNDQGGAVDVMVSFDGTWHKRGFTSNYGVGIVVDVMTGLVLDFEVLSKYCHACAVNKKRVMTEVEREDWRREHASQCEQNYDGSSKGMEKEAALRIWRRSVQKNGMRYTRMLSDGDSVAYKAVCDAQFYNVEKLECVNHCDKRMGAALRKKSKEAKLGGRRHGALTVNACNILQSYYRNAIMQNLGNADKMKEAIWASFLHCSSTDTAPQHQQCPLGPESWCFYNKAIAEGNQPPAHKDHIGTPLSADVAKAIQPIYERVSQLTLLNKIKHGRTQNANECVNGQIWARCPKTVHVGASRVNAAVASAVSHFNQGCAHLSQVVKQLGADPTSNLQKYQALQNTRRCAQAEADAVPAKKRARKQVKREKKNTTKTKERVEGQTYGPGMLQV